MYTSPTPPLISIQSDMTDWVKYLQANRNKSTAVASNIPLMKYLQSNKHIYGSCSEHSTHAFVVTSIRASLAEPMAVMPCLMLPTDLSYSCLRLVGDAAYKLIDKDFDAVQFVLVNFLPLRRYRKEARIKTTKSAI